ncbi:MAG: Hsp20/alpha crystallin family protein [Planctomycetota bacterium]
MTRFNLGLTPMNRLRGDLDRFFEGLLPTFPSVAPMRFGGVPAFPAVNVWEEKEEIFVEAEIPGMAIEDLQIHVKGNELSIAGERKARMTEGATAHRQERGEGNFRRVLRLPVEIDAEKVDAQLKNGVLTLRLPKAEAAKPRKIEIKCT